jgi:hypothetical protein
MLNLHWVFLDLSESGEQLGVLTVLPGDDSSYSMVAWSTTRKALPQGTAKPRAVTSITVMSFRLNDVQLINGASDVGFV